LPLDDDDDNDYLVWVNTRFWLAAAWRVSIRAHLVKEFWWNWLFTRGVDSSHVTWTRVRLESWIWWLQTRL